MGGTMRALTPEEIRHDPWDAADGGAVRFWITEKKRSVVNYTAHNQHVFRNNPLVLPKNGTTRISPNKRVEIPYGYNRLIIAQ